MKTIAQIFVLALILSSCTTRQGKENLNTPWYQFSFLATDATGKVDTVYMDGVTADYIGELPLITGELIEVQKTSIGYVYSSHEYVTREVIKTYLGIWKEKNDEILPIEKRRFKQILHGTIPIDPMRKIMDEEIKKMMPR